jgi:hypothetical protein
MLMKSLCTILLQLSYFLALIHIRPGANDESSSHNSYTDVNVTMACSSLCFGDRFAHPDRRPTVRPHPSELAFRAA